MDPIKEAFTKAKQDISELKEAIDVLRNEIEELKTIIKNPTNTIQNTSFNEENPTNQQTEFHKQPQYALKEQNMQSSIGNKGVPTNKQTNQQTDNQPSFTEVLSSLDSLKDRIKSQFLSLTKQEMSVFSTIYMLEDQGIKVDYPRIAAYLGLSESSIRDYVLKMIRKGIPIEKHLEKNKKVWLSIDLSLKRVAPLSALLLLREQR